MTNALERIASTSPAAAAATQIGQATAVEQARAVAEVQAAVIVAQQIPRDMERARAEMRDSCGRLALAKKAFYTVPNRGNGPSVHLARELARIWGNIDYGVHELRRDDAAGMSEVRAFAWDQQTNVRSTRTFQVPHARMKKVNGQQARELLIDLQDIYLTNQNIGARAVRECVFTVLPTWFTEEAQDLCRKTLEHGEGVPLPDRIATMVEAFSKLGIAVEQLEQKTGRKKGAWTAADVAEMGIAYTSITRDGLDKDELFPPKRVTAEEIQQQRPTLCPEGYPDGKGCPVHDVNGGEATAKPEPAKTRASAYKGRGRPAGDDLPAKTAQLGKLDAAYAELGIHELQERRDFAAATVGHPVENLLHDLTRAEASKVIDALAAAAKSSPAPVDEQPVPEPDDDGWSDPA